MGSKSASIASSVYATPAAIAALRRKSPRRLKKLNRRTPAQKLILRSIQPSTKFVFAESPLPSNFHGGNLAAFSPQTHGARRDAKPLGYFRSREKRIALLAFMITHG